jgi:hypothetical protein
LVSIVGFRRCKWNIPNLLKITVIKSEEVLILIVQTLNIMRYTLGEIPYITRFKNLGSKATVFINTGQQERAIVDKSPLGLDTRVSEKP